MTHLIVIDDTGSPGDFRETRFLKENRKTFVSVFIHSQNRISIENTLDTIISTLNNEFEISEIHLTDLVNRQNKCSKIPDDSALAVIKLLSDWFSLIQLPFIVQTCNDKTFAENSIPLQGEYENFDFGKGQDQALFLTLLQIKEFMKQYFPNDMVEIVIDEGRMKKNNIEKIGFLKDIIIDGGIKYKSSEEFKLLQVADFFAYALNKTQLTIVKPVKTATDILLNDYFRKVLVSQYSVGTLTIEGNINEFTKDDYDYNQLMQRQVDENLESWKKNQNI
jgi:hypothetical protein